MTKKKPALTGVAAKLRQFGLAPNDIQAYIFLLERGSAFGGSKIAGSLGLHRQYVHHSLKKLLELELIEEVPSGVRMKYRALSPRHFSVLAKKQFESAERAVAELEQISAVGAEQAFEVYRGTRAIFEFEEALVDSLKINETQYIIGGGAEAFINFYGDRYEEMSLGAKKKNLRTRYVGCPAEAPWLKRAQAAVGHFEYRILPVLPKTIVQTVIRLDSVTLYTFGTPPLVYIVKSKTVADDYKKFFEMLWKMAESSKL
ncbi:MAG: helix-turn-helix domain-containing protein [bacterium]|nr:helix-turn-helix domain-containing protein [bacterium]